MSAKISKALRGEVIAEAKQKRAGTVGSIQKMYREQAKKAASRGHKTWEDLEKRIENKVQEQFAL
jgi:hypothetical protein